MRVERDRVWGFQDLMRLLRRKNEGSMKDLMGKRVCGLAIAVVAIAVVLRAPLRAEQLSLQAIVTPSTTILKDGRPLAFAVHGFIEFKSLAELFPYIDSQTKRWNLDDKQRQQLARDLLRRGIESRIVSMNDERPLEAVITHASDELRQAIARVTESVPRGYADAFLAVQERSEEHTSELHHRQISYAGFCLKKKNRQ